MTTTTTTNGINQQPHQQQQQQPSPLSPSTIHITTHDASSGQARLHSSRAAQWTTFADLKFASATLYTTTTMPADLNDDADIRSFETVVSPPQPQAGKKEGRSVAVPAVLPNGTVCRIVDFEPHSKGFMHRTQSLDYGVVMEGEVVLELDDGSETRMTRGDVAIQRATAHAWSNPSPTEWARVLFVLQDCKPLYVGGKRFKEDLGAARDHVPGSANDGE